jgi:hypothetical protein
VLAELKEELANLDAAIGSLERLQTSARKRGTSKGEGQETETPEQAGPDEPTAPPEPAAPRTREKRRQP